jgi:hypothetical protein
LTAGGLPIPRCFESAEERRFNGLAFLPVSAFFLPYKTQKSQTSPLGVELAFSPRLAELTRIRISYYLAVILMFF